MENTMNFSSVNRAHDTFMENHRQRMQQVDAAFASIEGSLINVEKQLGEIDRLLEERSRKLKELRAMLGV